MHCYCLYIVSYEEYFNVNIVKHLSHKLYYFISEFGYFIMLFVKIPCISSKDLNMNNGYKFLQFVLFVLNKL